MSLGHGGKCRKILEDENTVIYEYSVFNWNIEEHKDSIDVFDGAITIAKSALIEPEIHSKTKRMPSGRKKLVTKRIVLDIDLDTLLKEKRVTIENASHCFREHDGHDYVALRLCEKIFKSYMLNGILPDSESFIV